MIEMMGLNMLMESMGMDAEKIQNNINQAVQHVAQINERIGVLEKVITDQRLTNIEAALSIVLNNTAATGATTLRIESAVEQLRTSSPEHSAGFVQEATAQFPDAAQQMQRQVEDGVTDAANSADKPTSYINGNGNTN